MNIRPAVIQKSTVSYQPQSPLGLPLQVLDLAVKEGLQACLTAEGKVANGKLKALSRLFKQHQKNKTFWSDLPEPSEEATGSALISFSALGDYIQKVLGSSASEYKAGLQALFANKPSWQAWCYGEVEETVLDAVAFYEHLRWLVWHNGSVVFLQECLKGEQVKGRLYRATEEQAQDFLRAALSRQVSRETLAMFLSTLNPEVLQALQAVKKGLQALAACLTEEGKVANGKLTALNRLFKQHQGNKAFWSYLPEPSEATSSALISFSALGDCIQRVLENGNSEHKAGLRVLFANKPSWQAWCYGEVEEAVLDAAAFYEHLRWLAWHGRNDLFLRECLGGERVKDRLYRATKEQAQDFLRVALSRQVSRETLAMFLSALNPEVLQVLQAVKECLQALAACLTEEGKVANGKLTALGRLFAQNQGNKAFWSCLPEPSEATGSVLIPFSALGDFIQRVLEGRSSEYKAGLQALFVNKPSWQAWCYGEVGETVLDAVAFYEHLRWLICQSTNVSFLQECLKGEQAKGRLYRVTKEQAQDFLQVALPKQASCETLAMFLSALNPEVLQALQHDRGMQAVFKQHNKGVVLSDPVGCLPDNVLVLDEAALSKVDPVMKENLQSLAACLTKEGKVTNGKLTVLSQLFTQHQGNKAFWSYLPETSEVTGSALIPFSALSDYIQKTLHSSAGEYKVGLQALFANKPSWQAWCCGDVEEAVLDAAAFYEHLRWLAWRNGYVSFLQECLGGEQVKGRLYRATKGQAQDFLRVALSRQVSRETLAMFLSTLNPEVLKALQDDRKMQGLFGENKKEILFNSVKYLLAKDSKAAKKKKRGHEDVAAHESDEFTLFTAKKYQQSEIAEIDDREHPLPIIPLEQNLTASDQASPIAIDVYSQYDGLFPEAEEEVTDVNNPVDYFYTTSHASFFSPAPLYATSMAVDSQNDENADWLGGCLEQSIN